MKKAFMFTLSVLCAIMLLCSCKGNSSELVGVWEEIDGKGILYFADDNTGLSANVEYTSESFEYEEKGEKLIFIGDSTVETKYTVEKGTLTIKVDGAEYLYKAVGLSESEIDGYLIEKGIINSDPPTNGKNETETETEPDTTKKDTPEKDKDPGLTDKEITESIVGAWEGSDSNASFTLIFNEDGTGYAALFPITYVVKDGVISITSVKAFGDVEMGSAKYDVEGDFLSLENEDGTHILHRTEVSEEIIEKLEQIPWQ